MNISHNNEVKIIHQTMLFSLRELFFCLTQFQEFDAVRLEMLRFSRSTSILGVLAGRSLLIQLIKFSLTSSILTPFFLFSLIFSLKASTDFSSLIVGSKRGIFHYV